MYTQWVLWNNFVTATATSYTAHESFGESPNKSFPHWSTLFSARITNNLANRYYAYATPSVFNYDLLDLLS